MQIISSEEFGVRIARISTVWCLTACFGSIVVADEQSKLANFNPFAKQARRTSTASTARISDRQGGRPRQRFRFSSLPSPPTLPKPKLPSVPKLKLPNWNGPSTANRRQGASTWNQLNNNTKRFFAKTKTTLMPWTSNQTNPRRNSNSPRIARRSERQPAKSTSFFANLFRPEPAPKKPTSINDFLRQDRPLPGR